MIPVDQLVATYSILQIRYCGVAHARLARYPMHIQYCKVSGPDTDCAALCCYSNIWNISTNRHTSNALCSLLQYGSLVIAILVFGDREGESERTSSLHL